MTSVQVARGLSGILSFWFLFLDLSHCWRGQQRSLADRYFWEGTDQASKPDRRLLRAARRVQIIIGAVKMVSTEWPFPFSRNTRMEKCWMNLQSSRFEANKGATWNLFTPADVNVKNKQTKTTKTSQKKKKDSQSHETNPWAKVPLMVLNTKTLPLTEKNP